jgi:Domain of unknown function (DUF4384)
MPPLRRLLFAVAIAATAVGCASVQRTDLLRKDVRTDAQNAIADTKFDHGDLTINVSTDRPDTTYDPGQPIALKVETNKDAYVAVLRVLENGDTTIIFPNKAHRDAAVKAHTALVVPAPGDPIKITADKPGIVMFEVLASTSGNPWLFKRAPDEGSDFAALGVSSRNIAKDIVSTLKVGGTAETAGVHMTVRITGRSLF